MFLLRHSVWIYVDGKPVADKLGCIRFEKFRQKYKSEHDDTLRTFYMAEHKLKQYFKTYSSLRLLSLDFTDFPVNPRQNKKTENHLS